MFEGLVNSPLNELGMLLPELISKRVYDFSIYINKVIFRQSGKNHREQKTRILKDNSASGMKQCTWCCLCRALGGQ